MDSTIMEAISGEVFGVWFLIGAALVFWMQAGFAMVEAGFTRAKNTGNIIMKNLMDFCIGTVVFILIGFSVLLGEDVVGLIGKPGFDIFTAYSNFNFSNFVFNLVFCATTATIVSGAMAERTKFLSYCIYSGVISALIYPIEAHWIWGGGWLSQLGFHDFPSCSGACTTDGVTYLYDGSEECGHLHFVVVCSDCIAYIGLFLVFFCDFCTVESVAEFTFLVGHLAYVVEESGALCLLGIQSQFGCHYGAEVCRFACVLEEVLSVAGAIFHLAYDADEFGM